MSTISQLMKTFTIYGCCHNRDCVEFWRDHPLNGALLLEKYGDRPWGPETKIKAVCSECGGRNVKVSISYSGLPHGEVARGVIGVEI